MVRWFVGLNRWLFVWAVGASGLLLWVWLSGRVVGLDLGLLFLLVGCVCFVVFLRELRGRVPREDVVLMADEIKGWYWDKGEVLDTSPSNLDAIPLGKGTFGVGFKDRSELYYVQAVGGGYRKLGAQGSSASSVRGLEDRSEIGRVLALIAPEKMKEEVGFELFGKEEEG